MEPTFELSISLTRSLDSDAREEFARDLADHMMDLLIADGSDDHRLEIHWPDADGDWTGFRYLGVFETKEEAEQALADALGAADE